MNNESRQSNNNTGEKPKPKSSLEKLQEMYDDKSNSETPEVQFWRRNRSLTLVAINLQRMFRRKSSCKVNLKLVI